MVSGPIGVGIVIAPIIIGVMIRVRIWCRSAIVAAAVVVTLRVCPRGLILI